MMNDKEDQEKRDDRTETTIIISQKKRDQNKGIKTKGSEQGVETTEKRHTFERRRF